MSAKEISFGNAYILAQLSGLTSLCVFYLSNNINVKIIM